MKIARGSISSQDLMIAVFCFMQGTVLRSGYIISITRQDSWAMAISGLLFSLPLVAIYIVLLNKFPEKNLFEINDAVLGPVAGRLISMLYLFFFLSLAALNMRDLGSFVVDYMMPETPIAVILLVFLIGCVYGIYKGIHNVLYLSMFICVITVAAVAINSILVLKDIQPDFLKPLFRLELTKYVHSTVSVVTVPMGEILVFTMLTPMLEHNSKAAKPLVMGLVFSALFMAMVIIRDIVTLGPLVSNVTLPSFESVRYISLSGVLTRMESIYAVVLILLFLFKISILLYGFVLGLTQVLRRKCCWPAVAGSGAYETEQIKKEEKAPPLLLLSAALVFFYSLIIFESVMENQDWGATTAPFFALTFELLLPALTLTTACLRRLGRQGGKL